jgi:F-type H+-transporting ATPase subunit b
MKLYSLRIALLLTVLCLLGTPRISATTAKPFTIAAVAVQEHQASEPPKPESADTKASKPGSEPSEGDEEAKFKQSASITKLAGWLHITNNQAWWLSVLINFGIIVVAIAVAAKSSLPGMFRERTAAIRKGIDDARRASAESSARLSDIEARLGRLSEEIGAMRANADQTAKDEEIRLRASAEEEKKKILQAAEQEITAAANLARRELKHFAAELAVSLAEKKISVNEATDKVLVRDFAHNLTAPGDGAKDGK